MIITFTPIKIDNTTFTLRSSSGSLFWWRIVSERRDGKCAARLVIGGLVSNYIKSIIHFMKVKTSIGSELLKVLSTKAL